MNAMNLLPLQVVSLAAAGTVLVALWLGRHEAGLRGALRRAVLRLDRAVTGLAALLACAALAIAVFAGAWQVTARFATETPSIWSEALVRTALIWMTCLGLGVALRAGALVAIDAALRASPPALRRALEAAALACVLGLMGVLFWFGWSMAGRVRFQEMAGLEISMSWGYAAIPIGACFAMVGALARFLDRPAAEAEIIR